ncbi:MAG: hypothetical protein ACM3X9_01120 [Bacillota bacterium]
MKITGAGGFSVANPLQLLNEINLKEGQKVVGRIIGLSTDEALLEIAGRPLQAKIEGNPPPAGTTQTFLVATDEQGRVVLKVTPNSAEATAGSARDGNAAPEQSLLSKTIVSFLVKDNLPPTPENVAKVLRYMQEFEAKYRQSLNPKVFTFLMAQKWPVTPATILASWIYQDRETRDQLWTMLQNSLPEKEAAIFKEQCLTSMKAAPSEIQGRLKLLVCQKVPGLFTRLKELLQEQPPEEPRPGGFPASSAFKTLVLGNLSLKLPSVKNNLPTKPAPESRPAAEKAHPQPEFSEKTTPPAGTGSGLFRQFIPGSKAGNIIDQPLAAAKNPSEPQIKDGAALEMNEPDQEKLKMVLDQNIAINKAILKENAVNGSSDLIPLLVGDSQSFVRECLIKWREEKSPDKNGVVEQVVYMTIPTVNMGDVNLALRVGPAGARINFRVNSEEIRRYLIRHSSELKETIAAEQTLIAVNLKETVELTSNPIGVDLWM